MAFWMACTSLAMIAAGWCSDKIFFGRRWLTTIFFQIALIILLLFIWLSPWLSPKNLPATLYAYLIHLGMIFKIGALISIFIAAIDLAPKKYLGISIGIVTIFIYQNYIMSAAISGSIIQAFGWHAYFAILLIFGTISTIALLFCRKTIHRQQPISLAY